MSEKQVLKDLDWVIQSAVMLHQSPPEVSAEVCENIIPADEQEKYNQWFKALGNNTTIVKNYFDVDEQLILGKYFERLLHFFFSNYPRYKIIESGKQLFIDGQTIGEIDFIVRDLMDQKNIHYEVAVKYYLSYRNSRKHDMWIGPNGRDTLSKKMNKFSKQLTLSEKYNDLISDVEIDKRQSILKGYLFQHIEGDNWPSFIHKDTERGKWMYQDEMNFYFNKNSHYIILPKSCWLSFYIDPSFKKMNREEAILECTHQLSLIQKGIMLVSLIKGSTRILEKMMILPSHWPKL